MRFPSPCQKWKTSWRWLFQPLRFFVIALTLVGLRAHQLCTTQCSKFTTQSLSHSSLFSFIVKCDDTHETHSKANYVLFEIFSFFSFSFFLPLFNNICKIYFVWARLCRVNLYVTQSMSSTPHSTGSSAEPQRSLITMTLCIFGSDSLHVCCIWLLFFFSFWH